MKRAMIAAIAVMAIAQTAEARRGAPVEPIAPAVGQNAPAWYGAAANHPTVLHFGKRRHHARAAHQKRHRAHRKAAYAHHRARVAHKTTHSRAARPTRAPTVATGVKTVPIVGTVQATAMAAIQAASTFGRTIVQAAVQLVAPGRAVIYSKNRVKAYVAAGAAPKFQCVVDRLEAAGYPIKEMGGFGSRPHNASAHPTGHAIDINQQDRDVTSPPMSRSLASSIAHACQVKSGGDWANGDLGHFEMLHSYGYVGGHHRRTMLARAHHRGSKIRLARAHRHHQHRTRLARG